MILPAGIDHVISGLAVADDSLGCSSLPDGFQIATPKSVLEEDILDAELTESGVIALVSSSNSNLPLVVRKGIIYRPLSVCVSKNGKCLKSIPDALGEGSKTSVSLIPSLALSSLDQLRADRLESGEKWIVQYARLTDPIYLPKAEIIQRSLEAEFRHVLHPGESEGLRHLTAGLHNKYSDETKMPSLSKFIDRFGLANCDMAAIGASQKMNEQGLLIASGSVPGVSTSSRTYIDFHVRTHAWNLMHTRNDPGSWVSIDVTPGSIKQHMSSQDLQWDYFVKERAAQAVVEILEKMILGKESRGGFIASEGDYSYRNRILPVLEHILKNQETSLYTTAVYLADHLGEDDGPKLLDILEVYPVKALKPKEPIWRAKALSLAALSGNIRKMWQIFSSGKPYTLNENDKSWILKNVVKHGDLEMLTYLLKNQHFEVDTQDQDGFSPFSSLLFNREYEEARNLLSHGANRNCKSRFGGQTPVHMAAHQGNLETLRFLKEMGADFTVLDDSGRIPLAVAKEGLGSAEESQRHYPSDYNKGAVTKFQAVIEFLQAH